VAVPKGNADKQGLATRTARQRRSLAIPLRDTGIAVSAVGGGLSLDDDVFQLKSVLLPSTDR